jgi:hypothetical protein
MNFLRTVIALCSGFANYRPYRDQALTTSLKHLVKLIALLALVVAISGIPSVLNGTDEFARRFDDHRPAFSIHDGKVMSQEKQPYSWGNNDVRFILDTTGGANKPDTNATFGVLFTSDSFLYWMTPTNPPMPVSTRLQSLRGFPNGVVNGDYFRHLVRAMLWLLVPLGWLLLFLIGMLSCLLQAYFFSITASFMERSMPAPLRLSQLLNIAIHACTPAAIVVAAYGIMRLHDVDLLLLVYLVVYGIFLVGATYACRDQVRKPEPPGDELL